MDPEGLIQISMMEVHGCSGFRIHVPPIAVVHANQTSGFIGVDAIVQCGEEVLMNLSGKEVCETTPRLWAMD